MLTINLNCGGMIVYALSLPFHWLPLRVMSVTHLLGTYIFSPVLPLLQKGLHLSLGDSSSTLHFVLGTFPTFSILNAHCNLILLTLSFPYRSVSVAAIHFWLLLFTDKVGTCF